MGRYIAFNKPFEVLSQFTDVRGRATLKDYVNLPGIYAAGRLDFRSEGLLLLTDDGELIHHLTDPRYDHPKTYLVQVEGICYPSNLDFPPNRIILPGLQSKAAHIEIISVPDLPPRSKPVRDYHPTTWLKVVIREGKKHQVRRMTAALGFPTLRLVRIAIGGLTLGGLGPGEWYSLSRHELERKVFG